MCPWNADRVLRNIQPPPGGECRPRVNTLQPVNHSVEVEQPQTANTAEGLKLSCRQMDKEARRWDDGSKSLVKRLAHAAEKAFADRVLLHTENGRLLIQNNEKRSRTSRPARKVGNAKVMSYENIIEAPHRRDMKKTAQARKRINPSTSGRRGKRSCCFENKIQ
ncbi:hypothetical protein N7513_003279 [Penicillium frequentans]|nr:hypothetical protein N7513_003279 [Penicillium glabrum]